MATLDGGAAAGAIERNRKPTEQKRPNTAVFTAHIAATDMPRDYTF
jgi:hypothetical protein